MKFIKKDTILRNGDILISPTKKERWILKSFEGQTFTLSNPQSGKVLQVKKNDLLVEPWQLEIGNGRGYW
ncbi:MAG TPA: hypothetical protein VF691_12530 [Cytophagaceae bacterium]|jgi:hypothetical protein